MDEYEMMDAFLEMAYEDRYDSGYDPHEGEWDDFYDDDEAEE